MVATDDNWEKIALTSSIEASPRQVIPAPVLGASHLPFDQLPWEDFERLQWRILRDVEGLRHARLYGRRGQKQYGLDIVALAPNEDGIALQSKRYENFYESDLKKAVIKFMETKRPFDVQRFIIGVACEVKDTKIDKALLEHQETLAPIKLELWDKEELSTKLRSQPAIVIEFFGLPTAEAFCQPFNFPVTEVPTADAVAIREALARTPEESTGAGTLFRSAKESVDNPTQALQLVEQGQTLLRQVGFRAHAAQYERDRSRLLIQLGRAGEAAREVLDGVWAQLSLGKTASAERSARHLQQIAADTPDDAHVRKLATVADKAISLHLNPLGEVPKPESLAHGELNDRLHLAVLAGETALANDRKAWFSEAFVFLTDLAARTDADQSLRTRLRLLIAETSDDWASILEDARKLRLGYELGALVTARYARNQALHQQFEEAEALWAEATGEASLKERWADASTWAFSRRAFRTRWSPFAHDDLLILEIELSEMGPSESILRNDGQAYVTALENLRTQKLRPAAIAAQRALRQSIAISDWVGEERARSLLGAILTASEEPELAAHHLTRGADVEAMKELAAQFPATYIDVIESLDAPNYWTVGTAYRLLSAETDLIPDDALDQITERILAELQGEESNTLFDATGFATSRYLGAIKTLAGIANRLTESQAEIILDHFGSQPPVEENHYRHHDEDEATTIARIVLSHPALQKRAITHLVPLLARSQPARGSTTLSAIDAAPEITHEHLDDLAQSGNRWAQQMLASYRTTVPSAEAARAALERLTDPLEHTPGVYTVGTNAVGDSLMIQPLPAEKRKLAITELLHRVEDPLVSLSDRNAYLLAASNLVEDLDHTTREGFLSEALRLATMLAPSEYEEFESQFAHKLGSLRVSSRERTTQSKALYLAACLADDDAQRSVIKQQAYLLLGVSDLSDYWVARVLQHLGEALDDDLGFLAGQSWAPRALAAVRWVKHSVPEHLGLRLAADADPRVRCAFAEALAETAPTPEHVKVRQLLSEDLAYSVRSFFRQGTKFEG